VSAIYLAADIGKRAFELFVEDIEAITDNSELQDVISILGDFNLPKFKWKVDEENGSMMPLNATSDLESDLIGGLYGCDSDHLVFTNVPVDMAVEGAQTPLLNLNRHHKANKIDMEAMKGGVKRNRFKLADFAVFFRVEGLTNAWTYSTRRSGAALKDMFLRDILVVNKNCHG
jgi:hypothetical protein